MEHLLVSESFLSGLGVLCFDAGSILAYLDPGSGAMVFQMIIASVAGAAVAVKLFWRNIIGIFRSSKDQSQPDSDQDASK